MKNILFILLFIGFIIASDVKAAEVFFGVAGKDVAVNTSFEAGVFINTQTESINAIEAQVTFPAEYFEFQGIYTGNSVIAFWVEQPVLTSPGILSFSGIIPGGFVGPKGYLFSLILTPIQKGSATIAASQETILLHDGNGTKAQTVKAPLTVMVADNSSLQAFIPPNDTVPPESFSPEISQDQNIFEGKWFLTFATQDKGSGIDFYQVKESGQPWSFKSLFGKNQWVLVQSPYLLQDQTLQSIVWVKAVDKNGNERIEMLAPKKALPWYENYLVLGIIIIIACIIFAVKKFLWKKKSPN